jgi:hypothetical protein
MDGFVSCQIIMVIQLALMLLHQMDSTYFKEWDILPLVRMGYTPFLVITAVLGATLVAGVVLLIHRHPAGLWASLVWGVLGLVVPAFHTYHYLRGTPAFRNFWSAALIYVTLINSVILIVFAGRALA